MKRLLWMAAVIVAMAAGALYYVRVDVAAAPTELSTATVSRGDVVQTVEATGTLQPLDTVEVGTQVSGTIASLGTDFNQVVKKGQVIATLDPALFQTQVDQARATAARLQSDVRQADVQLEDARLKLSRAEQLAARQLLPQQDVDTARSTARVAEAALDGARAQLAQAEAALKQAEVNLSHTVIASPTDGIVLSRNVEAGQTVSAGLQAPTLFVIARDLTRLELQARVDEADIGGVRQGHPVTFTVDAYPRQTFTGTVRLVRLQPQTVQNVVTLHDRDRRPESGRATQARNDLDGLDPNRTSRPGAPRAGRGHAIPPHRRRAEGILCAGRGGRGASRCARAHRVATGRRPPARGAGEDRRVRRRDGRGRLGRAARRRADRDRRDEGRKDVGADASAGERVTAPAHDAAPAWQPWRRRHAGRRTLMSITSTLALSFEAIGRNKLRSALTSLGIIMGVGAVIVMMALGDGAHASIEQRIASLGTDVVTVTAGSANVGGVRMGQGAVTTLTPEDAEAIRTEAAGVRAISPIVNSRQQIVAAGGNWQTQVQGAGAAFAQIRSWDTEFGSFFTQEDVDRAGRVVVLGSVVRDQIFGAGADPVGETVRVNNQPFTVIGVLSRKGQSAMGQDQDDTVVAPYTTVQKRLLGITHLTSIMVAAEPGTTTAAVSAGVSELLRQRHKLGAEAPDDFAIRSPEEMARVLSSTTDTMAYLLASVAAISLLVGGIGIMNIMLVSVTERTREIGLRRALGARRTDVLRQFVAEALSLSLAGGFAGVVLGIGTSYGLSTVLKWATEVSSVSILTSFGFAAVVGVVFGFVPARRAAALLPTEALRYE